MIVDQYLVVQVRAGNATGTARERNLLAHLDVFAGFDQGLAQVKEASHITVVVPNGNVTTGNGVVDHAFDDAIGRRIDGRAAAHREVGAFMRADAPGDRVMPTQVERGTDAVVTLERVTVESRVEAVAIRRVEMIVGAVAKHRQIHALALVFRS